MKTHIGRVFDKLNVRDQAQAVVVAYGHDEPGLAVRIGAADRTGG